ncbi:MAG: type VI secretion system baseplate subunit TssK [Alphaproteobacteria bacterium]|nr:type VI secretion system baseplate subunit TssK [Alphaproteobacteria bacterium]
MTLDNKVVWSEGMFLRAQHFQQFDRHVERILHGRAEPLRAHGWGFSELVLNRDTLSTGRVAVERARGILPGGMPFRIPEDTGGLPPLALSEDARGRVLHLAIPAARSDSWDTAGGEDDAAARYVAETIRVADRNAGIAGAVDLQVARPRLRLRFDLEGCEGLAVARVADVRPDRRVILDEEWIPAVLQCRGSGRLTGYTTELQGLLGHRAEALAARLGAPSAGVSDVSDFLLLCTVNRWLPLLAHFAVDQNAHPEELYRVVVTLAGDLAAFLSRDRRVSEFPPYRHDDLAASFHPVMTVLRQYLSAVLESGAIAIPLPEYKYGVRVGTIKDKSLFGTCAFVLAARAALPADRLRQLLPAQAKIGPVETIRDLVNNALVGIPLVPMAVAPRQIPYHGGTAYFELDRSSPFWPQLAGSGGLAVHVSGEFPQLEMECWAIRE